MAGIDLGDGRLKPLRNVASADDVGVLLGAGASMASGLPDWNTLAVRVLQRSGAIPDEQTARDFLARQDPILAVEAAKILSSDWTGQLREALYPDGDAYLPSALHLAAGTLITKRRLHRQHSTVFTLNFDLLLEEAVRAALDELEVPGAVTTRSQARRSSDRHGVEVQHLHGVLGPAPGDPAEGIVLSLSDFNELGARANPWQVAALQEAITSGPFVVAGTSYRDTDVRQWLHDVLRQMEPDHTVYALIAREGLGLSRKQFSAAGDAIQRQWESIGVQAVLLQDHSDAAQVLWELPELGQPDYQPPAQRIRLFWRRVAERFKELQEEHAALLEADLEQLEDLDARSTLTLWLVDDQGDLVRWAAYDRVHRDLSMLRRVFLGHDSPWVAARAAARNSPEQVHLTYDPLAPRWRSVVAAPVLAQLPGGPTLPVGAVSAACAVELPPEVLSEWEARVQDIAEDWGDRLTR